MSRNSHFVFNCFRLQLQETALDKETLLSLISCLFSRFNWLKYFRWKCLLLIVRNWQPCVFCHLDYGLLHFDNCQFNAWIQYQDPRPITRCLKIVLQIASADNFTFITLATTVRENTLKSYFGAGCENIICIIFRVSVRHLLIFAIRLTKTVIFAIYWFTIALSIVARNILQLIDRKHYGIIIKRLSVFNWGREVLSQVER